MTTETTKLKNKLASLTSSLSALESSLSPLFTQTLPETTVALAPIEQAKLQTLLPYIVYDLIFIYLKSKGIDPKSHPVVGELARVRRYFDKISSAETGDEARLPLDKAAAARFIKHAITQSAAVGSTSSADAPPEPSTFVPARVTSKMAERAAYEAELRARGDASSSDEELDIIDGEAPEQMDADEPEAIDVDEEPDDDQGAPPTCKDKGKGKAKAVEIEDDPPAAGRKRRRPAVDPFAGFGDDATPDASGAATPNRTTDGTPNETEDEGEKKRRKKEKKKEKARKAEAADASNMKRKKSRK